MDRESCLQAIHTASLRISAVAGPSATAMVPRYPGTDVAGLVRHVITIHEWVAQIVGDLSDAPLPQDPPDPGLSGTALLHRFDEAWENLLRVLGEADPDAPVWTFGTDKTVSFWLDRMAHETEMHRWDADSAVEPDPDPIPHEVAVSGLAEGMHVHCYRPLRKTEVGGSGEQVVLAATDADRAWTITLHDVGITVEEEESSEAVARVEGTASDLWLAVGGRVPLADLDVSGDEPVVRRLWDALESIPAAI